MIIGLHTGGLPHRDLATDVGVAHAAGFDAVELTFERLAAFDTAGGSWEALQATMPPLAVSMVDAIIGIETADDAAQTQLLQRCRHLCEYARRLSAPMVQVVALDRFPSTAWPQQRAVLVESLTRFCDVASEFDVTLALEPVVFSPFRRLEQALEVIDALGSEHVKLVVDTWHSWAAGDVPDHLAGLDAGLIATVHVSDSHGKYGSRWSDEHRSALPGEGVVPLEEQLYALRSCGYGGPWVAEFHGAIATEREPVGLASSLRRKLSGLLARTDVGAEGEKQRFTRDLLGPP